MSKELLIMSVLYSWSILLCDCPHFLYSHPCKSLSQICVHCACVYRSVLDQQQRQQCYKARDAFYECSVKQQSAGGKGEECEELKRIFHDSCPSSWVSSYGWERKELSLTICNDVCM